VYVSVSVSIIIIVDLVGSFVELSAQLDVSVLVSLPLKLQHQIDNVLLIEPISCCPQAKSGLDSSHGLRLVLNVLLAVLLLVELIVELFELESLLEEVDRFAIWHVLDRAI